MERTNFVGILLFLIVFTREFNGSNGYSNVSCIESERQALLNLKQSLTDLSKRLSSWVGEDCCTWRGVGCNRRTGHVVKLNLGNSNSLGHINFTRSCLGGEINLSLLELKYLNYLDLSWNMFTGIQIPKFFGSLEKLRYLNLSNAGFQGMVPHHLGKLSSLRYLDLNFYGGLTINNIKWVSHLSSLRHLDLSSMTIDEAVDWLHVINMPPLLELRLSNCGLRNIPPLSYVNLTSLAILDLSYNRFNSTIPHWLFNLSGLAYLNLGNNYLHGSNFDALANLSNLRSLDLGGNSFTGKISMLLKSLSCAGDNLEELILDSNEFHGQIPKGLGQFSKLEHLGISYNVLEGTVSELHFAKLRRLKVLEMSSNSLVLNVSSTWVPPFQLETLDLSSCKLGSQFPPWLITQRNISNLYMSNTSISDTIPDWFQLSPLVFRLDLSHNQIRGKIHNFLKLGGRSAIFKLDLSNNLLSGHIPRNIGNTMPESGRVVLSNNHLTGSVPMSLCKMEYLYILDLSKNHLSGQLPRCWKQLFSLNMIDLSNNNLGGHIPTSMGSLHLLSYLSLSNNFFYGELPSAMKNCTQLDFLDLSKNGLSGRIPPWIGESFLDLEFLNLQSNIFDGHIPRKLCRLAKLQLLDLSHNNLSGTIPICFGNFSSMQLLGQGLRSYYPEEHMFVGMKGRELEYTNNLWYVTSLDLSSNNMVGGIPEALTNLKGLCSLDLSGNHLTGRIPEKIGNLTFLESLDFSRNQLSGPIPTSISALTFLSHLNLSYNNLSGPIPMGNQLQTLDDPTIYVGNAGLCGRPLQNNCTRDDLSEVPMPVGVKSKDANDMLWFYAGLVPGFACGFLAVFSVLLFKKTWRYTYFRFIENITDSLLVLVFVAVKAAWLKKAHRGHMGS